MSFQNLSEMQRQSCKKFESNPLFGTKSGGVYGWITYQQFAKLVDQCRGGLVQRGVTKGDVIACIANNRVEWAVGAYATYSLGAVWVPMYEQQLPKDWKYIVDDSTAKVLLVATDEIYAKTKPFIEECETLEHVIKMSGSGEDSWDELLKIGAENSADRSDIDPSDTAGLIYTSGTTGSPKGVVLSHGNFTSNINAMHDVFPMDPDDRSMSFLPWAHSFGQTVELHALMSMGASLGISSAATLLDDFGKVRPTILISVPRVFNKIYDGLRKKMAKESAVKRTLFKAAMKAAKDARRLQSFNRAPGMFLKTKLNFFDKAIFSKVRDRFGGRLKYAFSGGAALSKEVAEFIDSMNITVYEGYGLTETSPICTANRPGAQRIGSVGKPIPGVDVVIDGADGKSEVEGEIVICGPNVMQGYFNLPEKTEEVIFEKDGRRFFRTGDLGRLDSDGYLHITGRVKELYKLENGKYVAPSPLEEQMQLSGFIVQAFLHGANKLFNVALIVPDQAAIEEWAGAHGLGGKSFEDLCEESTVRQLIKDELANYCRKFKGYERPKAFQLIPEEFTIENEMLTPSMKVKRRMVTKKYGDMIESLHSGGPT